MWGALKDNFGVTSLTHLRTLITKFDNYKKDLQYSINKHLRVTTTMIRNSGAAGHTMSDQQEIQGVLVSLPDTFGWELFKYNMAHLETIEKFADRKPHIELEDESLTMDKFKKMNKVVLIESAHPLPYDVQTGG